MLLVLFLKGILIGIGIAAPVGPIGVLCIRKTLAFGRISGFLSGLGAAVADTFYGVVAVFGLTVVSNFLLAHQFWFRLIGGAFLIYLAVKTYFAAALEAPGEVSHKSYVSDFISTLLLTLTNPMTILAYVAVFAALGLSDVPLNYFEATLLVLGVFAGSALWWLILSEGVTLFRKRVNETVMKWINRSAGLLIFVFGILAWASIFI